MNSPYSVVILAAGEGKRMHPLTAGRPKCMLPVAGIPLVEHLIKNLFLTGIRDVILVVGYHAEKVQAYFGDGSRWSMHFRYAVQPFPAGTAAALMLAADQVGEQFLVINADVLASPQDLTELAQRSGNVLGVKEVTDASRLGVVEMAGDRIIALHEKLEEPPTRLASTGIYLFDGTIFQVLRDTTSSLRGEYELPTAIQLLIDRGVLVTCQQIDSWQHVSFPWELLPLNEQMMLDMQSDFAGIIEPGVHIEGPCRIGQGTCIRSGSYITGPVLIGKDCDIGPNCYIRPATAIGDGCRVGAGVEIKNCIIMSDTKLSHLNYAGDSVIGENCNLGAGAKIANLRLDGKEVWVSSIPTGLTKLGAILGDGVQLGVNACLNPGTIIPAGGCIGPGEVVSGSPGKWSGAKPQAGD